MKKDQLISRIDDVLKNYQFSKKGFFWNREYADFVDVIDFQISKSNDMFAINAGIADKFVIDACWGMDGYGIVDEPSCTVRARLGKLLYERDVWWSLSDDDGIERVLNGIQDVAIPFLEHNHSTDHMIEYLENDLASGRYPPEVIYLALLYHQKGESDRCRDMFKSMKLTGDWTQKATEILNSLN